MAHETVRKLLNGIILRGTYSGNEHNLAERLLSPEEEEEEEGVCSSSSGAAVVFVVVAVDVPETERNQ